MKQRTILIDEHASLEAGLSALRFYNRAMFISLDGKNIDEVAVKKFFEAEPNSEEEKEMAKLLTIAAAEAMYHHPDIPQRNKAQCAKRVSKEFLEALNGSKATYNLEAGRYGSGLIAQAKYEEELKKNSLACRAASLSQIKKKFKKMPTKLLKKVGIKKLSGLIAGGITHMGLTAGTTASAAATAGTGAAAAAGTSAVTIGGITLAPAVVVPAAVGVLTYIAIDTVITIIPPKTKKQIKDKCRDFLEKGCNIAANAVERFENTKAGRTVTNVLDEKVAPVLERGAKVIEEAYDSVKMGIKSGLKKFKSGWTKLKSYFA